MEEIYDLATGKLVQSRNPAGHSIDRVRLPSKNAIFGDCRDTGTFVLVSPRINNTLAGGVILISSSGAHET